MQLDRENNKPPKKKVQVLLPMLLGLILVVGIVIGVMISDSPEMKTTFFTRSDHDKMEEILNYIDHRYVDTVNSQQLFNEAVTEIFQNLDPHSMYISAESLAGINESLEGHFEGIGIEFFMVEDTIVVVTPISEGPSERAGLQSGDKIVLIEDTIVAGQKISNEEIIKRLKGPKGSKVRVAVMREGENDLLPFTITRGAVNLTSIDAAYMMDDKVGYIKINRFASNTHQEFRIAVKKLKNEGMQRMVLDLRDNGGGYLDAAVRIADELLDGRKLVVYTEGRSYPRKNYKAGDAGLFEEGEMAVLINENSASASEILAGALQDWNRATIIGRRSYGKALVQDQIELQDGSAMRLTVARYYTPKGKSIQRPYDEGVEAYHEAYMNRILSEYENTDSFHQADTAHWGIMPDLYVAYDTSETYRTVRRLINRGHVPTFIYKYFSNNRSRFRDYKTVESFQKEYNVSDDLFRAFVQYVGQKEEGVRPSEIQVSAPQVKAAMKAYIGKQLFAYAGFYPVLNTLDHEVDIAYGEVR